MQVIMQHSSLRSLLISVPAFYRQILQLEYVQAELFHNATVLREINGPEDVQKMPTAQKQLALRSIDITWQGLDLMVNSLAYREGMKYGAMQYECLIFRLLTHNYSLPSRIRYSHIRCVLLAPFGSIIVRGPLSREFWC